MSSFWSFGLFGTNFQLFSAVLVENGQTHFGDMSSFVRDLAKSDCTKVTWWTWHLCALQVSGVAQHKGDMSHVGHIMRLCIAICASNTFIIPEIFISYNFYVISNRKSCGNGLISLRVDMSPLCSETCSAQRCYVQSVVYSFWHLFPISRW